MVEDCLRSLFSPSERLLSAPGSCSQTSRILSTPVNWLVVEHMWGFSAQMNIDFDGKAHEKILGVAKLRIRTKSCPVRHTIVVEAPSRADFAHPTTAAGLVLGCSVLDIGRKLLAVEASLEISHLFAGIFREAVAEIESTRG